MATAGSADERRLGAMSAATWRTAVGSTHMRSAMTGVFLLDRAPDPEKLSRRMRRITELFPALRSHIIESSNQLGRPRLVVDPDFDLSLHVAHYVMPAPGSWQQVLRHARRYSLIDLDRDRPLWRAVLLDGLRGGRSAVILVVHHAIADGQGLVKIVSGLFDPDPEAAGGQSPPRTSGTGKRAAGDAGTPDSEGRTARAARLLPRPARGVATTGVKAAGGVLRMAGSAHRIGQANAKPLSPILTSRGATYTPRTMDISFPSLRGVAKEHGGSINDAFLAGLMAGIRLYHEASEAPAGKVRVNVPVSFRTETSREDDNTQAIARIVLDTSEQDPQVMFNQAREVMAKAVREPVLAHMDLVAEASRLLPVDAIVAMSRGSDLTASNVPGIPVPVWLGGARVERIYPVVATLGAAANITLLSYAGRWCSIGVTIDDAAVERPDLFVECLARGYAEIGVELADQPYDPLPEAADDQEE